MSLTSAVKLAPNCATCCNVCCGHSSGDRNHAVVMRFHFCCYIKRLFCGLQAGIMVSFYLLQFWLIIVFVLLITICYALYSITSLSSIDSMSIFYVALRQCWDCFETVNRYSSISVEFAFGLALASDLWESRGNAGLPEFLQLMLTDEGHICHGHSCVSRAGYRLNYACRIVSPFCTQKLPDKSKVFSMTFKIFRSARVLLRLSYIPYKIRVVEGGMTSSTKPS